MFRSTVNHNEMFCLLTLRKYLCSLKNNINACHYNFPSFTDFSELKQIGKKEKTPMLTNSASTCTFVEKKEFPLWHSHYIHCFSYTFHRTPWKQIAVSSFWWRVELRRVQWVNPVVSSRGGRRVQTAGTTYGGGAASGSGHQVKARRGGGTPNRRDVDGADIR
jgi:hypothetical protein